MAEAHAALRSIAFELVQLEERCQEILVSVPRSPIDREITGDLPTELLTTIECVLWTSSDHRWRRWSGRRG
jgi:hypothetical protein